MRADKEEEQIRILHEKYPNSLAYTDWKNKALSLSQRELEFKLETLTNNCKTLLKERDEQHGKLKNASARPPIVLPELKRFRGDREYCLRALSQVKFPEPPVIESDLYAEERSFPAFVARLERFDMEYEDALMRLQRLEGSLSARFYRPISLAEGSASSDTSNPKGSTPKLTLKTSSRRMGRQIGGGGGSQSSGSSGSSSGSSSGNTTSFGNLDDNLLQYIHPDDLRIMLRETVFSARTSKRLNAFLAVLHWLPYTHRYEVVSRAQQIFNQPKGTRQTSLNGLADERSESDGVIRPNRSESDFYNAQKRASEKMKEETETPIPVLISDTLSLDAVLYQLGRAFSIADTPRDVLSEGFSFRAARLFADLVAEQKRSSTYPLYSQCELFVPLSRSVESASADGDGGYGSGWKGGRRKGKRAGKGRGREDGDENGEDEGDEEGGGKVRGEGSQRNGTNGHVHSDSFMSRQGGAPTSSMMPLGEQHVQSYGLQYTFIKASPWVPYAPLPHVSQRQDYQQGILARVSIDGLLRVEMESLKINDLDVLLSRAKSLANTHGQRITTAIMARQTALASFQASLSPSPLSSPSLSTSVSTSPLASAPGSTTASTRGKSARMAGSGAATPASSVVGSSISFVGRNLEENLSIAEKQRLFTDTASQAISHSVIGGDSGIKGAESASGEDEEGEDEEDVIIQFGVDGGGGRRSGRSSAISSVGGTRLSRGTFRAGAAETAANSVKRLKKRKLIAMYLLRHARCVEMRERLLSLMNYFSSVQRKITLDALGFPWECETKLPGEFDPNTQRRRKNIDGSSDSGDEDEMLDENNENRFIGGRGGNAGGASSSQKISNDSVDFLLHAPLDVNVVGDPNLNPAIQTPLLLTRENTKALPISSAFTLFTTPEMTTFGFNEAKSTGGGGGVGTYSGACHINSSGSSASEGTTIQTVLPATFEACPQLTALQMRELKGLIHRDDICELGEKERMIVRDCHGVTILYEEAITMMTHLESELLRIVSHFLSAKISKEMNDLFDSLHMTTTKSGPVLPQRLKEQLFGETSSLFDRQAMLSDILECEALFQRSKRKVVDLYVEAYECCCDPNERKALARLIIDLLALRPRIDLSAQSFVDSYATEIICLEMQFNLLHAVMSRMINDERRFSREVSSTFSQLSTDATIGLPLPPLDVYKLTDITLIPRGHPFAPFEFPQSIAQVRHIPAVLEEAFNQLVQLHHPATMLATLSLHAALLQQAIVSWVRFEKDESAVAEASPSTTLTTADMARKPNISQATGSSVSPATTPSLTPEGMDANGGATEYVELDRSAFVHPSVQAASNEDVIENPVGICAAVDTFVASLDSEFTPFGSKASTARDRIMTVGEGGSAGGVKTEASSATQDNVTVQSDSTHKLKEEGADEAETGGDTAANAERITTGSVQTPSSLSLVQNADSPSAALHSFGSTCSYDANRVQYTMKILKLKLSSYFDTTSGQSTTSASLASLTQISMISVVALTHALEAVRLRHELLYAHKVTELLFGVYKQQAECVGLRVRRFELEPINFEEYNAAVAASVNTQTTTPSQAGSGLSGSTSVAPFWQRDRGDPSKVIGNLALTDDGIEQIEGFGASPPTSPSESPQLSSSNAPQPLGTDAYSPQSSPSPQSLSTKSPVASLVQGFTSTVHVNFAISEFDPDLADFDFSSFVGCAKVFGEQGLTDLRHAVQVQVLQRCMLEIVVQYNQIPLDQFFVFLKEKEEEVGLIPKDETFLTSVAATQSGVEGSVTNITEDGSEMFLASSASAMQLSTAEQMKKLNRWERLALREASSFFVPLNSRKLSVRELRLKGYSERVASILKLERRGEISKRLRQLKFDMIRGFCSDMSKDMAMFALRVQHSQILREFRIELAQSPNISPFVCGSMTADDLIGRTGENHRANVSTPFENLLVGGNLTNVWYIPHERELFRIGEDVMMLHNMRAAVSLLFVLRELHIYSTALYLVANPSIIDKMNLDDLNKQAAAAKLNPLKAASGIQTSKSTLSLAAPSLANTRNVNYYSSSTSLSSSSSSMSSSSTSTTATGMNGSGQSSSKLPTELDSLKVQLDQLPFAGDPFLVCAFLLDERTRYDLLFRLFFSQLEEAFLSRQNHSLASFLRRTKMRIHRIFSPPGVFQSTRATNFSSMEGTEHFLSSAQAVIDSERGQMGPGVHHSASAMQSPFDVPPFPFAGTEISGMDILSGPFGRELMMRHPELFPTASFASEGMQGMSSGTELTSIPSPLGTRTNRTFAHLSLLTPTGSSSNQMTSTPSTPSGFASARLATQRMGRNNAGAASAQLSQILRRREIYQPADLAVFGAPPLAPSPYQDALLRIRAARRAAGVSFTSMSSAQSSSGISASSLPYGGMGITTSSSSSVGQTSSADMADAEAESSALGMALKELIASQQRQIQHLLRSGAVSNPNASLTIAAIGSATGNSAAASNGEHQAIIQNLYIMRKYLPAAMCPPSLSYESAAHSMQCAGWGAPCAEGGWVSHSNGSGMSGGSHGTYGGGNTLTGTEGGSRSSGSSGAEMSPPWPGNDGPVAVGKGLLGGKGVGHAGLSVWGWNPSVAEMVGEGGGGVFIDDEGSVCIATGTNSFAVLSAIRTAAENGGGEWEHAGVKFTVQPVTQKPKNLKLARISSIPGSGTTQASLSYYYPPSSAYDSLINDVETLIWYGPYGRYNGGPFSLLTSTLLTNVNSPIGISSPHCLTSPLYSPIHPKLSPDYTFPPTLTLLPSFVSTSSLPKHNAIGVPDVLVATPARMFADNRFLEKVRRRMSAIKSDTGRSGKMDFGAEKTVKKSGDASSSDKTKQGSNFGEKDGSDKTEEDKDEDEKSPEEQAAAKAEMIKQQIAAGGALGPTYHRLLMLGKRKAAEGKGEKGKQSSTKGKGKASKEIDDDDETAFLDGLLWPEEEEIIQGELVHASPVAHPGQMRSVAQMTEMQFHPMMSEALIDISPTSASSSRSSYDASSNPQSLSSSNSVMLPSQLLNSSLPSNPFWNVSTPSTLLPSPSLPPSPAIPSFLRASTHSPSRLEALRSLFTHIPANERNAVLQEMLIIDIAVNSCLDQAAVHRHGSAAGLEQLHVIIQSLIDSIALQQMKKTYLTRVLGVREIATNEEYARASKIYVETILTPLALKWFDEHRERKEEENIQKDAPMNQTQTELTSTRGGTAARSMTNIASVKTSSAGGIVGASSGGPLRGMNGKEMKLSSSRDLRPEGVTEREWTLLQLDALRRELDKMLIIDAMVLVEMNCEILFAQIVEEQARKDVELGSELAVASAAIAPTTALQSGASSSLASASGGSGIDGERNTLSNITSLIPRRKRGGSSLVASFLPLVVRSPSSSASGNSMIIPFFPSGTAIMLPSAAEDAAWEEKVGVVSEAVSLLLRRGISVTTDSDDSAILFTRSLFMSSMEDMLQGLCIWGDERQRQGQMSAQLLGEAFLQRLNDAERELTVMKKEEAVREQMMRRRVQSEIAERAVNFVFEIERLRNLVTKLEKTLTLQDEAIRKEVKTEYDDLISKLQAELLAAEGNFRKYKGEMQNSAILTLHQLTMDSLKKISVASAGTGAAGGGVGGGVAGPSGAAGSVPYAPGSGFKDAAKGLRTTSPAPGATPSISSTAASGHVQQRYVNSGTGALSGTSSVFGNRDVTRELVQLRQSNAELEKQVATLENESRVSQFELKKQMSQKTEELEKAIEFEREQNFESIQERDAKIRMLELQLEQSNTKLNDAVSKLETVQYDLDVQSRNKTQLMEWKATKSRVLKQLEEQLAKYRRWSNVDIDKLYLELERKENELKVAEGSEVKAQKTASQIEEHFGKEIQRLRKIITQEKRVKEDAMNKLDEIRGWLESTGLSGIGGGAGGDERAEVSIGTGRGGGVLDELSSPFLDTLSDLPDRSATSNDEQKGSSMLSGTSTQSSSPARTRASTPHTTRSATSMSMYRKRGASGVTDTKDRPSSSLSMRPASSGSGSMSRESQMDDLVMWKRRHDGLADRLQAARRENDDLRKKLSEMETRLTQQPSATKSGLEYLSASGDGTGAASTLQSGTAAGGASSSSPKRITPTVIVGGLFKESGNSRLPLHLREMSEQEQKQAVQTESSSSGEDGKSDIKLTSSKDAPSSYQPSPPTSIGRMQSKSGTRTLSSSSTFDSQQIGGYPRSRSTTPSSSSSLTSTITSRPGVFSPIITQKKQSAGQKRASTPTGRSSLFETLTSKK
ncbi:uncharacterized protein MONOS_5678 [Monocercomonoides exilis]|uniref:uncharacterized protein n=1 Tax=Monocercomonoides exilis TaxID=2049356 RepID=UPI00355A66D0|nr:hypothetical protein MONOS_5678 [Monocercomonoides exilis]